MDSGFTASTHTRKGIRRETGDENLKPYIVIPKMCGEEINLSFSGFTLQDVLSEIYFATQLSQK